MRRLHRNATSLQTVCSAGALWPLQLRSQSCKCRCARQPRSHASTVMHPRLRCRGRRRSARAPISTKTSPSSANRDIASDLINPKRLPPFWRFSSREPINRSSLTSLVALLPRSAAGSFSASHCFSLFHFVVFPVVPSPSSPSHHPEARPPMSVPTPTLV
uniref:Uncharacterized protein n=1 Tax=Leishmania guyanensis TaxID=5670 RepID=A0A1E1J960_LEIGU|nr:Hypothetical protein BN36_NA76490 [Leishmania guyanensis]CCM43476.1 Hypothetical protein BN36_NA76830 [Leishmania guyanensis]